jgi:hypothetical protein
MKTRFEERLEKMRRRYFEIFGDLEVQAEFLKLVALVLFAFLFLALTGAFIVAKRPPVVIRVTEVGAAETIRDIHANNAPTSPEILYFAKTFTRRYGEYNAYTLSRDMAEAMNFMTSRYQKTVRRELVESGLLARIEEAGLHAAIEFKEETIEHDTPEYARVSLIGVRTIKSYKNPDYREASLFKAELVLRKFPRTRELPWGLLVEQYREILLNKLEEVTKP